jgi:hypothetical protein
VYLIQKKNPNFDLSVHQTISETWISYQLLKIIPNEKDLHSAVSGIIILQLRIVVSGY